MSPLSLRSRFIFQITFLFLFFSLVSSTSGATEIAREVWQQKFNPATSSWNNAFFWSVGYNNDGSVLVSGTRGEADSASAIGIRYDAQTGSVLDSPPEWFLFENNFYDYAQDNFYDQYHDAEGNIYFVGMGYAATKNTFSNRFNVPNIWKYANTYNNPEPGAPDRPLWRQYHVTAHPSTEVTGSFYRMAVDSSGNIYVVGYYAQAKTNRDWIIDKYDSDGTRAAGYPLALDGDGFHDYANGVAVDSEDNVIVVGAVLMTDDFDWVVRKYQSDGTLLWETQYDFAGGHDSAITVTTDSEDNIIVGGYRRNVSPNDENDWYIVKYSKGGDGNGAADVIWEQTWDDGNSKHGNVWDVALDGGDNFYVIGVQQKDSLDPAYTDRYKPVLQFRAGSTGELIKTQDVKLIPTVNNQLHDEHDYLRRVVLKDGRLLLSGYTQQGTSYSITRGRTGRVLMLELLPMFRDGFEQ